MGQMNDKLRQLIPVGSPAAHYNDLFSTADKATTRPEETIYIFDNGTSAHLAQGLVIEVAVDTKTLTIKRVVAGLASR